MNDLSDLVKCPICNSFRAVKRLPEGEIGESTCTNCENIFEYGTGMKSLFSGWCIWTRRICKLANE